MATITWPTTRAFMGSSLSLSLDVSESTYTGFLTNNRQRRSNSADRLRAILTIPPHKSRTESGQIEALLMGLKSNGDFLSMGVPHRPSLLGTLRGTPKVSVAALAGARSITISGVRGINLLLGGSFEVDLSGNGVAEPWVSYGTGSTGTVTHALSTTGAVSGTNGQQTFSTALSTTTSDRIGVKQSVTEIVPGTRYAVSAWYTWLQSGNAKAGLYIDWRDSGGSIISGSPNFTGPTLGGTSQRHTHAATAPSGAASCDLYFFAHSRSVLGAASVVIDAAQFEVANAATDFQPPGTLLAGDFISIGGNLLTVAYAGASANDAGLMTVPLTLPLQKPLAVNDVVIWSQPTGLWELDDAGLQIEYTAGVIQGGIAIPLRQVIA